MSALPRLWSFPPFVCRIAVASLLLALTVPRMAQRGMFGDGLVYATIARNLSIGSGSFWAPRYTETAWAEFYEHPPLGLALEAAAFRLLGDYLIVERMFSLIPMFALGFASIARGVTVSRLMPRPASRASTAIILGVTFTLASIITLVFAFGPGRSRDAVMLQDLDAIDRAMPRDLTIGACRHPRSSRDWGLHTYAQRWFRVSLDARDMPINGWLLRAGEDCAAPSSCSPVARGDTLTLLRCPEPFQRTSH